MRHYNIPIFIPHLGCPFNCIFCDQNKISAQHEVPDKYDTIKIIDKYLSTIPSGADVEVAFFGGSFTCLPELLQYDYLSAVTPYIEKGIVNGIRISTRPDAIDRRILQFLKSFKVKTIELGVQSLNDEVLKASARGYKAEDVFKACRLIREEHFQLGIQLMIGLPGDSLEKVIKTTRGTISLQPDMVRIYPTLVIAGTALETMLKNGNYIPLSLREAVEITSYMFMLFQKSKINVIRMGLQPGEDLRKEGTVIAGPFHPSFGELVEQNVFGLQTNNLIKRFFEIYGYNTHIKIYVNPRDISKVIGNRKNNLNYLKEKFQLTQISINHDNSISRDQIGISTFDSRCLQQSLTREEFISIYCNKYSFL